MTKKGRLDVWGAEMNGYTSHYYGRHDVRKMLIVNHISNVGRKPSNPNFCRDSGGGYSPQRQPIVDIPGKINERAHSVGYNT